MRKAPVVILLALPLLGGCQPAAQPVPRPDAAELRQAAYAERNTPSGARQECLGRLVFEPTGDLQWGLSKPGSWSGDRYRFTEHMHGGHDDVWLGSTQIIVMAYATRADLERMARSVDADKDIGVGKYRDLIETDKRRLARMTETLADRTKYINQEDLSGWPQATEEIKAGIADMETRIANLQKDWHPMDMGRPDSLGYAAGPDLYAFVLHEGRIYKFLRASGEGQPPFEQREREFRDLLQRFQFRKLYELPTERGICVPYGFVPDDGRTSFRIAVSLRYADQPGVIYTLGTGVVGENGVTGVEPSGFKAIARAGGAGLAGLAEGREVQRIGPKAVRIGALPAQQGGIAMNVADAGKAPVNGYSVYTGYGGWGHSQVLPYITVDMRSFTRGQEPTLKVNPPPLADSMARLDALLQSIRLRPTRLPMPELAELPEK